MIYAKMAEPAARRLLEVIRELVDGDLIEIYQTRESLAQRLCTPLNDLMAVIICPSDGKDLHDIIKIGDLLWDVRVILILPDNRDATVNQGHVLKPRFVAYADGDFADVSLVLSNIINRDRRRAGRTAVGYLHPVS
ncbi:MAG: hypothetical protein PHY31_09335 [Smithellaceae bacterium]|nr:hypothetical protein [Smithellaceae bacterium]